MKQGRESFLADDPYHAPSTTNDAWADGGFVGNEGSCLNRSCRILRA